MGMDSDKAVLSKMQLDFDILDAGCCGMAGSFGFERGDRYQVSIKAGERVLLPAVRNAAKDVLIIADGFSCREQVAQTTDRHALHLAQVIQMALSEGTNGPPGDYPERAYLRSESERRSSWRTAAMISIGASCAGALIWMLKKRS